MEPEEERLAAALILIQKALGTLVLGTVANFTPHVLREFSVDSILEATANRDLDSLTGVDRAIANALTAFVHAPGRQVDKEAAIQRGNEVVLGPPAAPTVDSSAEPPERVSLTEDLVRRLDGDRLFRGDFYSFLRVSWSQDNPLWPTARRDIREMNADPGLNRHVRRALPSLSHGLDGGISG